MIPRHRLRGRRRFAAVRREGLRASVAGIRVQISDNGGLAARVGLAVSGVRTAVVRNRIRRRLREAVRPLLAELAGHDVVLSAGVEAARLRSADLADAVGSATRRVLERSRLAPSTAGAENGGMGVRGGERR